MMARIALVRIATGDVVATTENSEHIDPEEWLAFCARSVAPSDPPEWRHFQLWQMPVWDGMTEADYYAVPGTRDGLTARGAEMVSEMTVPKGYDYLNQYGE